MTGWGGATARRLGTNGRSNRREAYENAKNAPRAARPRRDGRDQDGSVQHLPRLSSAWRVSQPRLGTMATGKDAITGESRSSQTPPGGSTRVGGSLTRRHREELDDEHGNREQQNENGEGHGIVVGSVDDRAVE